MAPDTDSPNDDSNDNDESDEPDINGDMFVVDTPGLPAPPQYYRIIMQASFEEYLLVRFDGQEPLGNNPGGSRASAKFEWHVRHHVRTDNGAWVRTTGSEETEENDIAPGRIEITDDPPQF